MESRRKISAALVLVYLCAMVLNAVVVLTCDCASCHSHISHHCPCEMCVSCQGETSLSQHCECTHTHENLTESAVATDSERSLKLIKMVVAELPRALVDSADTGSVFANDILSIPRTIPINEAPLLSTGVLRAPPIFA